MKKLVSLGVAALAIATHTSSLDARESYAQSSSETLFLCATEANSSTMYAHTPGNSVLTPLMSWHQDYLLPGASSEDICQQAATKLQTLSQDREVRYIAREEQQDRTAICMVTRENGKCSAEDSEEIFSLNNNYSPDCVLDLLKPLECSAMVTRGGILETIDSPYRPIWWPW